VAITLTSATRVRPLPCNHFDLEVSVDGTPRHVFIAVADLDPPVTEDEIQAYVRLWARYHRNKGVALNTLVGKAIIADIP
jgi:hypothetical protein